MKVALPSHEFNTGNNADALSAQQRCKIARETSAGAEVKNTLDAFERSLKTFQFEAATDAQALFLGRSDLKNTLLALREALGRAGIIGVSRGER